MMEQYISFETAKLAKEKGFPQEPNRLRIPYYNYKGVFKGDVTDWLKVYLKKENTSAVESVSAPTQSLLQKWLREEHGIHIVVIPTVTSDWTFKTVRVLSKIDHDVIKGIKSISELPPYNNVHGYDYTTYEEALEQGLLEALKLIK